MTEPQQRIDARTTVKLPLSEAEQNALTAYLDAIEESFKVCNTAVDNAWDAYLKARITERDVASARAHSAHKATLDAATSAAGGVHCAATTAARAAYVATGHASPLVHWLLDYDNSPGDEVGQVIEALAEGMSLQGVIDMAEEQGWCDTWDKAFEDACERFNFIG